MKVVQSVGSFIVGFCKRIYWTLLALIADPFGLAERLFNFDFKFPNWAIWSLFALGCMIAFILTFNDIRKKIVVKYFSKRKDYKLFNMEVIKAIQDAYSFKGRKGLITLRDILSKPGTYEEYIDAEINSGTDTYNVIVYPHSWDEKFPAERPESIGVFNKSDTVEKLIISKLLEKGFIAIGENRIVKVCPELISTLDIFLDYS